MINAKANPCSASPPKKYSTTTTSKTVKDVNNVRLMVWLVLSLTIFGVMSGSLPRTSRIRSKTTIVSLTE